MRILPLLPAALLLTGATAPSINDLAECRLDYEAARAMAASVPLNRKVDDSKDGERHIANYFGGAMPTPFGLPAISFGTTDVIDAKSERFMVITTFRAPYAQVRAAAMQTHGESSCIRAEENGCMGTLRTDGDRRVAMIIVGSQDQVSLGCAYIRNEH